MITQFASGNGFEVIVIAPAITVTVFTAGIAFAWMFMSGKLTNKLRMWGYAYLAFVATLGYLAVTEGWLPALMLAALHPFVYMFCSNLVEQEVTDKKLLSQLRKTRKIVFGVSVFVFAWLVAFYLGETL